MFRRSEDSATSPSPAPASTPSTKSARTTARPLLMNTPSSSGNVSERTRQAKSSKKSVRPAISSAPPSYETAVATKEERVDGGGMMQASVMTGVGMAALYCAKMAWEIYSSSPGEARDEEESEEEEKEERKTLGWLGV
ncbi:hypothetical protein E2P81_ATG07699 [Venturia nashicola]|uniref:Uncharacterized protein n=1 Tax=Venturia nashicola TaxID=86259 RepID=A0A4Z1NR41_9PEZI|nr:hypothetical protein E6O75_ATG07865 [Venturia nashicola]TLD22506.1 hypothetical protein E2P81_ATG07699 [Venturia nashicola]